MLQFHHLVAFAVVVCGGIAMFTSTLILFASTLLAIFASSSRRSLGERRCDAGYYENQQHVDHEKREGSVGREAL